MQWTGTLLRFGFGQALRCGLYLRHCCCHWIMAAWFVFLHFFLVPLCWYAVSERQVLPFFAGGLVGVDKHLFQRVSFIMYRSNRSFNMPPRAYPGHLTPLTSPGGGNLIIRVFQGVGNLIPMLWGWEIWTAPSISSKIFGVASYHGGCGVRGFSWKRLCICGQLGTRKELKQALCRIWSI